MSAIEIIAVVFSLACIFLAVKRHVLNWPLGIIAVSAYLILFYRERLYADMVLQVVFIGQGAYGWYNWIKNKNEQEIEVSYLSNVERSIYVLLIVIISLAWAYVLKKYTNASMPYVDALASTISLLANLLLARKRTDNWILWIVADIIYVTLFWYKELYLSSGIYALFLVLAIKGLYDWNRKSDIKKVLL